MGPLHGIRIIELAGIGPAPFASMMLADQGAEVLRVARKGASTWQPPETDVMNRNRRAVALDLKRPQAVAVLLELADMADGLIEGFRPGVMERLGLGPEVCLARNPRLVYGRMTGWGQTGPLAHAAGHDLNYISLAGALWPLGEGDGPPMPPLNLVGDYGGGGMLMAFGMVSALLEADRSGLGQVVDAAMVDGAALLMASHHGYRAAGMWGTDRGANFLDGSAPHYRAYECADGKWIGLAPLEEPFYVQLLAALDLDPQSLPDRADQSNWPALRARFAAVIKSRTRAAWCDLLEGSDVCFAPVLDMEEAPEHEHNRARGSFVTVDGLTQPAPAPRFGRTPADMPTPSVDPAIDGLDALRGWGVSEERIAWLRDADAL